MGGLSRGTGRRLRGALHVVRAGRRRALQALVLAWLVGTAACGKAAPALPAPDVLLVVCDTLRADRTAVLHADPAVTPWLRSLGGRGTVFVQALAPSSWTLPSMAALFSGLDATGNRHAARTEVPSLAERFAQGGYATVALSANPLLTGDNGFLRGFERHAVAPASSVTNLHGNVADLRAWDAEALVARALQEAAATEAGRPLFLWLQPMDAHLPYDPAHGQRAAREPGWSAPRAQPPSWDAWRSDLDLEQAVLVSGWRRAYDGQVAHLDAALQRLEEHWSAVRRRPLLIAVTSDHGEGLFDHARNPDSPRGSGPLDEAYSDHGEQLTEEALRVPLLLAGPGVPAGRRELRAVGTRDLGATLLRLAGLPAGGPTLPLAPDDPAPERLFGAGTRGWWLRQGERLLIEPYPARRDVAPQLLPVTAERLLLRAPDLGALEPGTLDAMRRVLAEWRAQAGDEPVPALDAATRARLEALGYLR